MSAFEEDLCIALPLQAWILCPHCWHEFPPGDALWIAKHPDLLGDEQLGPDVPRRFLPKRFTVNGAALDAHGVACHELACPRCRLPVPRPMIETPAGFVSVAGAPGCGKSTLLASAAWRLREVLPKRFGVDFRDADLALNRPLQEAESLGFLNLDPETPSALAKTDPEGDWYDLVQFGEETVRYPHPLVFRLAPREEHPRFEPTGLLARTLCLYDNAGDDFLPEDESPPSATGHLTRAQALLFLFDPTQHERFRKACRGKSDDPQMRPRKTCMAHERPVAQEAVLLEAARRRRAELEFDQADDRPLVVVLTKYDSWCGLLGGKKLPSPYTAVSEGGLAALNLKVIADVSRAMRSLLKKVAPEIVSAAEGCSTHVIYLPASATGRGPQLDASGILGIRPKDIQPMWAEVPLLYLMGRWLFGRDLLPTSEPSEQPADDEAIAAQGMVLPTPLVLDMQAADEATGETTMADQSSAEAPEWSVEDDNAAGEPAAEAAEDPLAGIWNGEDTAPPAADQDVLSLGQDEPIAGDQDVLALGADEPELAAGGSEPSAPTDPSLDGLVRLLRLLALGRGPIRLRLDVLRKLAAAAPSDRTWGREVRVFERERLKEIEQEVKAAKQSRNLPALAALAEELAAGQWLERPPESLVQKVSEASEGADAAEGLAEMTRIADLLNEAHAAGNLETGRQVRQRWDRLNTVWGLEVDEALAARAAAPLQWLHEEDQRQQRDERVAAAVGVIQQALDDDKPPEELQRIHRKALRPGDELPRSLEQRYRERIEQHHRRTRWQKRLTLGGNILAGCLIVAVLSWLVFHQIHVGRVKAAAEALEPLLEEDGGDAGVTATLQEAEKYLDQLAEDRPGVAADPRIEELGDRLRTMVRAEDLRTASFQAKVAAFREGIARRADRSNAEGLEEIRDLARTGAEQAVVAALKAAMAGARESEQDALDRKFLRRLEVLTQQAGDLARKLAEEEMAGPSEIAGLLRDLTLLEGTPNISDAARDQAKPLAQRLAELEAQSQGLIKRKTAADRVTGVFRDAQRTPQEVPARLTAQLSDYLKRLPGDSRSAGFTQALQEAPLWEKLVKWNQFIVMTHQDDAAKLEPKQAADWAAKLNALLQEHGDHPDAEAFRRRLPYLEAIARRLEGGKPIQAPLKKWLAEPAMTSLWLLQDKNGRRFYLKKSIDIKPESTMGFDYFAAPDLSESHISLRPGQIVSVNPAPQKALATRLLNLLDLLQEDHWDRSFYRIVELTITDPETDPLLKLAILKQALAIGCQGSRCMQVGFAKQLQMLSESKVPATANWLNPGDAEGIAHRKQAQAELGALPDYVAAGTVVAEELKGLRVRLGTEYRPIGWLRKRRGGAWECAAPQASRDDGKLLVAHAVDGKLVLDPVGQVRNEAMVIETKDSALLVEGRPVYWAAEKEQR